MERNRHRGTILETGDTAVVVPPALAASSMAPTSVYAPRGQPRVRRPQRCSCRKALLMTTWALLGLWSYGFVGWALFKVDDINLSPSTAFNAWSNVPSASMGILAPNQEDHHQKRPVRRMQGSGKKTNVDQILGAAGKPGRMTLSDGETLPIHRSHKKVAERKPSDRAHLDEESFVLWIVIPLCLVVIVSIHRLSDERRDMVRHTGVEAGFADHFFYALIGGGMPSFPLAFPPIEQPRHSDTDMRRTESMLRMLALINHDRMARGEPTISIHSYMALQQVLTDSSIWTGLAERYGAYPTPSTSSLLTKAELERICPQWTLQTLTRGVDPVDDAERRSIIGGSECSICLSDYELSDTLRTMPCGHTHHARCIDQWMEHSTLCPLCKQSIECRNNAQ